MLNKFNTMAVTRIRGSFHTPELADLSTFIESAVAAGGMSRGGLMTIGTGLQLGKRNFDGASALALAAD